MKSQKEKFNVGYIGMSHLGLCYLAAAASKSINVIGIDKDKEKISKLKDFNISIKEPLLKETLKRCKKYIKFDTNLESLNNCKIVFISQDVQTNKNGKSDLSLLNYYLSEVIKYLEKNTDLVLLSQVQPGFTRKIKWPKQNLYYQVETLVFGNAIERATNPERIIIGTNSSKLNKLNHFYKFTKLFTKKILIMNFESAEITKISINLILISNISAANEIGLICEKINANWTDVYGALILDKRIGKYSYIKTGLGLSGGNLERDLYNSIQICKSKNISNNFFNSLLLSSNKNKIKKLSKNLPKNSKIGLLGISYKENTNSVKNSPALEILKYNQFKNIYCYDPMAELNEDKYNFKRVDNFISVINKCELLIIMTKWDEFRNININILKKNMRGKIIIDPFGILYRLNLNKEGFRYFSKGESKNNGKN